MESRIVRHVLVIANWKKEASHELSQKISDYLATKGIESTIFRTCEDNEDLVVQKGTDLVICLGGDGTVLYSARYLQDLGIPILAINLGTFGYITEISVDEWQESIDLYLSGKNLISRRLMIRVAVLRDGKKVFTGHGLNELVISSSGVSKVIGMAISINQTKAGYFRSDGLIVATPTGSTGYSLAAGGPILDADLSSLILTPICPFTLSNRPLVVSSESKITISIPEGQRTGIMLSLDGQQTFPIHENDVIIVEKSRSKALLVTSERRTFIAVIREKLNWSGGGFHA